LLSVALKAAERISTVMSRVWLALLWLIPRAIDVGGLWLTGAPGDLYEVIMSAAASPT
jgi:hypothetical protein